MKPSLINLDTIEPGSSATLITSSDQRLVQDLPAAVTPEGVVVSRWEFNDAERAAVARGGDLYLFIQTHGRPVQPVSLVIRGDDGRPVVAPLSECDPPETADA